MMTNLKVLLTVFTRPKVWITTPNNYRVILSTKTHNKNTRGKSPPIFKKTQGLFSPQRGSVFLWKTN